MKVLNDILDYDLKIYQDQDFFCFSLDSVILANLAKVNLRTRRILDLGSGNGIIPLILSLRTSAFIEGVEIQKDLVSLARESIQYNNLDSQIKIYHQDMRELQSAFDLYDTYDLIVSNPPYFKENERSTKNKDIHKVIARHEVSITLDEIVDIASRLLKEGGTFSMIHRVDRFMEILFLLKQYKLEPKYVRFVYDNINIKPNMVYIEAIKGGKSNLIVDKPFILYYDGKKTEDYEKLLKEVM